MGFFTPGIQLEMVLRISGDSCENIYQFLVSMLNFMGTSEHRFSQDVWNTILLILIDGRKQIVLKQKRIQENPKTLLGEICHPFHLIGIDKFHGVSKQTWLLILIAVQYDPETD